MLTALAALAAAVTVSGASPDANAQALMATRFDNTTVVTDTLGRTIKIYYNRDGTLSSIQGTGTRIAGTWRFKPPNVVCVTWERAIEVLPNPTCVPAQPRAVGDSWSVGGLTFHLQRGR